MVYQTNITVNVFYILSPVYLVTQLDQVHNTWQQLLNSTTTLIYSIVMKHHLFQASRPTQKQNYVYFN